MRERYQGGGWSERMSMRLAGEDVVGRKDKAKTKERRLALMHRQSNGMGARSIVSLIFQTPVTSSEIPNHFHLERRYF
jgi:hypothetical protein